MLLNVTCKAFLVKDGKILLLRLGPKGGSLATVGSFDLPGGRIMAGESFAEVLQREIWEEIAVDLNIGANGAIPAPLRHPVFVDDVRLEASTGAHGKVYEATQYIRLFFMLDCAALGIDARQLTLGYEHDDFVWVAPQDAGELVLFPGTAEAIQKVFSL